MARSKVVYDPSRIPRHPETRPSHVLREEDMRAMAKEGILKEQHFLIRLMADGLGIKDEV